MIVCAKSNTSGIVEGTGIKLGTDELIFRISNDFISTNGRDDVRYPLHIFICAMKDYDRYTDPIRVI